MNDSAVWSLSNPDSPYYTIIEIGVNFLGILAAAGITIWIFKKGVKAERKKERKRVNEIRVLLIDECNNLAKFLGKQIEDFQKSIKELDETEAYVVPNIRVELHANNISWIGKDLLYRIFVSERKGLPLDQRTSQFRNFNGFLEYLDGFKPYIQDRLRYYDQQLSENRYYDLMNMINQKVQGIKQTDSVSIGFVNDLQNLLEQYEKVPNKNTIQVTEYHFLKPLQNLCSNYNGFPVASKLSNLLEECIRHIPDLIDRQNKLADELRNIVEKMNGIKADLENLANDLSNHKHL